MELCAAFISVLNAHLNRGQARTLTQGRERAWREVLQAGDAEGLLEPLVLRIETYTRCLEAQLGPAEHLAPGPRFEEVRTFTAALLALVELSEARPTAGISSEAWIPLLKRSLEPVLDRLEAVEPSEAVLPAISPTPTVDSSTAPAGLSAESLHAGVKAAFKVGDLGTARAALELGRSWYPDATELQALARILRPPKVLGSAAPVLVSESAASRQWLEQNAEAHHGDWVAIFNGELLGSGPSLDQVRDQAGPFPKGTLVATVR